MKILFLDDNSYRIFAFGSREQGQGNDVRVAMTAQEAIEALSAEVFDVVYLDHDLGGKMYQPSDEENCGMAVAEWIVEKQPPISKIVIHSWNLPAAKRMWELLYKAGYDVVRAPFRVALG